MPGHPVRYLPTSSPLAGKLIKSCENTRNGERGLRWARTDGKESSAKNLRLWWQSVLEYFPFDCNDHNQGQSESERFLSCVVLSKESLRVASQSALLAQPAQTSAHYRDKVRYLSTSRQVCMSFTPTQPKELLKYLVCKNSPTAEQSGTQTQQLKRTTSRRNPEEKKNCYEHTHFEQTNKHTSSSNRDQETKAVPFSDHFSTF